jgi:hypothetical protein
LYPINTHVSKLFLIKLNKSIQSPLSIYCLSSFSFSLLVYVWFLISNSFLQAGFGGLATLEISHSLSSNSLDFSMFEREREREKAMGRLKKTKNKNQ